MHRKLLAATIAATFALGCSSSPTAPTPVGTTSTQPASIIGQWTGTYRVTSCVESGSAAGSGFCSSLGQGGGLTLTPQQTGQNVSGNMGIGGYSPIPVTGTVGTDNVVALSGSGPIQLNASLSLTTWRGTLSGSSIAGNLGYTITTAAPVGIATVQGTFTVTK